MKSKNFKKKKMNQKMKHQYFKTLQINNKANNKSKKKYNN